MLKSPFFMGGKMIKLETLEKRVKTVLTNHPEARDDDMKLYFIVCQECFYKTHHITEISFKEFIYNYREQLAAGHSDDTALTESMDKGWGWLSDKGFDFIQTDWPMMLIDYLKKTNKYYR